MLIIYHHHIYCHADHFIVAISVELPIKNLSWDTALVQDPRVCIPLYSALFAIFMQVEFNITMNFTLPTTWLYPECGRV